MLKLVNVITFDRTRVTMINDQTKEAISLDIETERELQRI